MKTFWDLFCGCGGMSLGFEREGWKPTFGLEWEDEQAATYAMNRPGVPVLKEDVRKVDFGGVVRILGRPTALVGGPPCQGFSTASNSKSEAARGAKRRIYYEAIRVLGEVRPKVFIFENSPVIAQKFAGPVERALARIGRRAKFVLLYAKDFGVPQIRRRAFLTDEFVETPEPRGGKVVTPRDVFAGLGRPLANGHDPLHTPRVAESVMQRRMAAAKPGEPLYGDDKGWTYLRIRSDCPTHSVNAAADFVHWATPRKLTFREYLRLQRMPDSYKFYPNRLRVQVARLLPPPFARAWAKKLKAALSAIRKYEPPELSEREVALVVADLEKEIDRELSRATFSSGAHPHPHDPNGQHEHEGLPPGGGHAYFQGDALPLALGAHRHRPDDPLEGAHVGTVGDGRHDHPEALGRPPKLPTEELVRLHRERPWLPGFMRALIRERATPADPFGRWREWNETDSLAHALHPTHHVTPAFDLDEHERLFLGPERLIDKLYEFEGGVVRPVKKADFEAEGKWFGKDSALPSGPVRASPQSSARTKQRTGSFILQRRHWRVREVVREGPSMQFWHIRFDWAGRFAPALLLSGDPAKARSTTGTYDPRAPRAMLGRVGTFPTVQIDEPKPKEVGSVTVEEQDRGKAELVEEGEGRIVVRLAGRVLSGEFAVRDEGGGVWSFSRTEKFRKFVPIVHVEEKAVTKRDEEPKRLVYGIVYEPFKIDAQGDWATPETIEAAAHRFLADSRQIKLMHRHNTDKIVPVESYIAPQDFSLGRKHVAKGSWIMVSKVLDPALWARIKAGEFRGYSLGGRSSVADAAPPVAA